MPFPDDDANFKNIGPIEDELGQTYIYPSNTISKVENMFLLQNAHRNYTMGNLARIFTLSGVNYLIGPDDDEPFYETSSSSYLLACKAPIYRVSDRYEYAIFLEGYSCTVKVEICDDTGTVLSFTEIGIAPDTRDFDNNIISISSSYDVDDIMFIKVWMKKTTGSSGDAKLYHLVLCENYSNT